MVLSDNNKFDPKGGLVGSPHNLSTTLSASKPASTQRSWTQVVTKNRKSLLHPSTPPLTALAADPTSTETDKPTITKTSIWRPCHGLGSTFIDMSGRKETKIAFLRLVADQYPSRVGVLTQQAGSLKFAEINFDSADEAFNTFLTKVIKFADNSTVIHCKALDHHMQVVRLRLSNLPFLGEGALLEGLQKSLQTYGDILDVGILLETVTRTYMCIGYAVLNVASKTRQFEPLTHLIPWDEQHECGFYAVWNQMPLYCRYCHDEGHAVSTCPKRRLQHTCWNCGEAGHIAARCSRDKPSKRPRKQVDRTVKTKSIADPIIATPHDDSSPDSMEILFPLLPATPVEVDILDHPVDSPSPSAIIDTVSIPNQVAPPKIALKRPRVLLKPKTP